MKAHSLLLSFFLLGYGTTAYSAYEATQVEQQIITALQALHALREQLPEGELKRKSGLSQEKVQKDLFTYIQRNWQRAIKELVRTFNAQLNEPDSDGITPLCYAATAGSPHLAMLLVSLSADPNLRAPYGMTPLICAILNNRIDTAKFFLSKGVNIDAVSDTSTTPLGYAIRKNHIDMVECLLRAGADPNGPPDRISPLQTACIFGYIKIVRILIRAGARINLNGPGTSPLHLAAKLGHVRVMKLLLEHGANREALTDARETPLSLAIEEKQPEAVACLIEHYAKFNIYKIKKLAKNNCLGHVLCSLMPYITRRLGKSCQSRWIDIVSLLAERNSDNFAHWSNTAEGQMCQTLYRLLSPFMRHKPIPYLTQMRTLLASEVPQVIVKELFDFIGLPWRDVDKNVVTQNKTTQVGLSWQHIDAEHSQPKIDKSADIEIDNSLMSSHTCRSHAGKRSHNEQDRRFDNHTETSDNEKRPTKRRKKIMR